MEIQRANFKSRMYCNYFVISLMISAVIIDDPVSTNDIPKNVILVCKRNDPNLNQCIINAGNHISKYLATGVPELNIPSLEPLIMDEFISDFSAGMLIKATNVKAYGCSKYNVRKLKFDKNKLRFDIDLILPRLRIMAKYKVTGQLLNFLSVNGSGNMDANVTDCRALVRMDSKLFTKDNETYWKFVSMKIKVKVGSGRAHLDNFFNGNDVLGDVINGAINDNFQEFLSELLPVIERNLASRFLVTANEIIEPYTFDQLMPPN